MGNNYAREGHMLESRMIELVKNHLDISISTKTFPTFKIETFLLL